MRNIIDGHVNLTPDGGWFGTDHNASYARLTEQMRNAGVAQALLIAMPGAGSNAHIAELCQRHPDKFRGLGFIDNFQHAVEEMKIMETMGLNGLKLHPRSQKVDVLDPAFAPLWNYLCEKSLPVMIDGYYQNVPSSIPLYKLTPFYYDQLARQYPELKIILAHAGAQRAMDAFWVARSNPNFYLDISHCLRYYAGTSLMQDLGFVIAMADRKVIFGSDFPEYSLSEYLTSYEELCGERVDIEHDAVLGGNLAGLINFN